jgi:MGT family glycosyltransferase
MDIALERFGVFSESSWVFQREKLNIFLFPKFLQPCAEFVGEECFYAGRCAGEQPYYGDWQRPDTKGQPTVFIATSTHYLQGPEYFKGWIEALNGLQWRVILSIGDSGSRASLGELPPNFEVLQNTSHVKVLPHVSLLIFLGGIISSAEAAYHGIPLLVTSQGILEQEWEAENLARLGLGIHLRGTDLSVDTMRNAAINIFGDMTILTRMKEVQRIVRSDAGAEEAANRIEEYLEGI